MNRPARLTSSNQGRTRQLVIRNPTIQTGGARTLAVGLHVNMDTRKREVEEARRKMQMKYDREAEEAAQKKKEREQKKREAWLHRQEALVRPGHVLGRGGTSEKNLLRDLMEQEDGDECQDHTNKTEQNWVDQHYNYLVQQKAERERESFQLQRRQEQSREVTATRRSGDVVRRGVLSGSGPPNQTGDYFLGTGCSTSPASLNSNGHLAQAHRASPGNATGNSSTPFHSNSHGLQNQASVANRGHILRTGNAISPESNNCVPDVQPSHREEMLAARRRLQEQYDAQLKEAAKAKEQKAKDTAEERECSSSN